MNNDSILTSIKKLLNIDEDYTDFDQDIIIHINSVLSNLTQMGIGVEQGLAISDKTATWSDFISDSKKVNQIRSYVYIKVRILFDPPQNSFTLEALKQEAKEMEYRLYTEYGGY